MAKTSVGIALGGGGVRGAAHIGVLSVLHKEKIYFDQIAGTSAGAIIGAMYAATLDPDWMMDRFNKLIISSEFEKLGTNRLISDRDTHSAFDQIAKKVKNQMVLAMSLHRTSIISRKKLKNVIDFLLPVKTFEELKIPLSVAATDLQNCEPVIYNSGNLIQALVNSAAIPGYVDPALNKDSLIVDGGVSLPIPGMALKNKVDFIINVDIRKRGLPPLTDINIYEIMMRANFVTYLKLTEQMNKTADFVISPNVKNIQWSQFEHSALLFESGCEAAENSLKDLKSKIKSRTGWAYALKHWIDKFL
ncbi:MAG: patatin-like phospholipase family protein [Candidatus Neomarinimicrobiota bacterium]